MFDCMWEFLVGNRSLTKNIWASERPSKLIWWRLHIHMSRFAFHGFPCSPSPASSDRLGHLAFKRRPSFAKFYQNFREKSPYINFPADGFPRVWLHDFKKICREQQKTCKFSWFCNIAISLKSAQFQGAEKKGTKTLLFAGHCNMSIFFWALKMGGVFWGVFRFAVVSATFSSHFLSSLASEPFCCDLAQVKAWGIFKHPLPLTTILHDHSIGVSSTFAVDTVWNVSLQHFPYIVYGTSVHFEHELHYRFGHV